MSDKINDGGPVFPHIHTDLYDDDGRDLPGPQVHTTRPGLSLRDWFAGQALSGLLSSDHGAASAAKLLLDTGTYTSLANCAFNIADAMLAAREARQ